MASVDGTGMTIQLADTARVYDYFKVSVRVVFACSVVWLNARFYSFGVQ